MHECSRSGPRTGVPVEGTDGSGRSARADDRCKSAREADRERECPSRARTEADGAREPMMRSHRRTRLSTMRSFLFALALFASLLSACEATPVVGVACMYPS